MSPLDELAAALATVSDLPVEQRPDVFAAINDAIVAELAAMEPATREVGDTG